MGTIQDKLNILASTTEAAVQSLSQEELEEEKKNASVVDYKMVTFSLAGKDYAIDIMKVKEIAKAGNFTYVPNTLPFVLGVYNLRGEIIPIIDLRLFFNIEIPPHDSNVLENMLIVQVGEQFFGVVVDVIDKVVGIQKSSIQPPHPLFGDINIKYISGVVEAQRHLYILLDIDKIFGLRTPEEERLLAETARAQLEDRQAAAAEIAAREEAARQAEETAKSSGKKNAAKKVEEPAKEEKKAVDLNFIYDSLKNLKKFYVSAVNEEWIKSRYEQWEKERGEGNTQLQNESDADEFLKPFFSKFNGTWWSEPYASEIAKALPDNPAKNIVVWNPGCGKGFE
ncbi:MAG: chemotaxis protein CheW, partial [Treponema sp.]|nr:chemotaxis protein CheW [Treponema sp.]